MVVLLTEIIGNINLTSFLVTGLSPRGVSADGYITVLKIQMEIWKDGRQVNILTIPI